jgi:signal transduction histidine kinase/DNA-binding response OmpR family regulator/HAMP domain-containing protein
MKFSNLKIGIQLLLSFSVIILLIAIFGILSNRQTSKIHEQTEIIFNHPFQIRMAVGNLKADVYAIHRDIKDLFIAENETEISANLYRIDEWDADAIKQIEILSNYYLGEKSEVDSIKKDFIIWKSMRQETILLFKSGNITEAANRTQSGGTAGKKVEEILSSIEKVANFAENKGKTLFNASEKMKNELTIQLVIIILAIIILMFFIYFLLMKNIRKPLVMLTTTTRRFDEGELSARCTYQSNNELGVLSESFNSLADNIQATSVLNIQTGLLADMMLIEDDAQEFFRITLQILMEDTNSQMVAVYLLSDDKKKFEHFESIGIDEGAKKSFSAKGLEGEMGAALATKKIQHLKKIPETTRFVFNTVGGQFIPREIITMPILSGYEVIALISLTTVHEYSDLAIQLINKIHLTYCARIDKILTYRKIKEFSETLASQNRELEAQKIEMTAQSVELTEQNRELEVQKQQLNEANKLKTSFLSNMSHELRTPLNSVIALSGVLNRRLNGQIPDEEYSYLEVIERNGKNLLSLINNILDIARIESGREEIEITEFNVCDCINEVVAMIHPQTMNRNLQLENVTGDCNLRIRSDATKIKHILQNLIGNAIKFTEEGKVSIVVSKTNDNLSITISDTGVGISKEHLPHIFDEFRQADGSTARKYGGTGLGLSIAKKYANLLGGVIAAQSIPEEGSEFILTLPLEYSFENMIIDDEEPMFRENVAGYTLDTTSNSEIKTILLVEDSEAAIIQIKDFLEESGYRILVAGNGKEGLEIISQTIPDAIILDLMMPGIDGFELLQTIRNAETTVNIPVLILTAKHITKEELKFLKRNNIFQLIQKGYINREELLITVSGMVKYRASAPTVKTDKELFQIKKSNKKINDKPKVLLVEDNPDNLVAVKAIIADKYTFYEAVDAPEGIAKAKQHQPDLILMDISLPGMDGIEAFKIIRENENLAHIPIVALTASALIEDRETILAHGFDGFLAKPIDEKLFFTTINELLYGK